MILRLFLSISLPLYILDQITKILIKYWLFPGGPSWQTGKDIEVIPGFFDLVRVHNTGMAFGKFNDVPYSNVIFVCIAAVAMGIITWLWRSGAFPTRMSRFAVALLVPGILGNVTDRIWHGYVIDFLHFDLGFMIWPSFNVADSCICIAAGLLFISSLKDPAPKEEVDQASEESEDSSLSDSSS